MKRYKVPRWAKTLAFCPKLEHPNDQTIQFIPLIKATKSMSTSFPWEFLCLGKENDTVMTYGKTLVHKGLKADSHYSLLWPIAPSFSSFFDATLVAYEQMIFAIPTYSLSIHASNL